MRILPLITLCLVLTACGIKGALELPQPVKPGTTQSPPAGRP
ncbi:lipoprotein [Uliginosibacterium sp. 31-16]